MGRKWTPEQRKAASERAKAAMAAKEKESPFIASQGEDGSINLQYKDEVQQPVINQQPQDPGTVNPDYAEILKMVKELKEDNMYWRSQAMGGQAQANVNTNNQGNLVGTLDKYKLDPSYYPDPRQRLSAEVRLQRFAFPMNYELEWSVGVSSYKTIDGVNTREPKFTLQLNRIVMDEETGEQTNGRYGVCQMIFHEDPEAALTVARENGLDVAEYEERDFLNEMRYLRMRDWLLEAFYPPKPAQDKKNKKEMVVNGKLVDFWEINSESPEAVPFSQLKNKG